MDADEKQPTSEGQSEPSVLSEVKEERILARRKRVNDKIETARREALGEQPQKEEVVEVDLERERRGRQQEERSALRLEKLVTDGSQLVSNVAVAGDSKEVLHRQEEEETRKARYDKLEAEVTAGAERFNEIMRKWLEGKGKRVPQELQELLVQQKAACSAMVDEKDKLINELQQELKAKDDQYVKHLKKQAEDVDLLVERMEEQGKTLLKAYYEELGEIEKAFQTERQELLEGQHAEWEEAMQQRRDREKWSLEERERRIEENEAQLQHVRVRNMEEFNRIKVKLETDVQILQQQIQQMKATFQLNAEKLEYNFQVLRKRDDENTVTISQQKRKITRLQDTLNTQKGKLTKQEKGHHDDLQTLMEEYRKNTEQYRELQKKVKHFQLTDAKRFHDIWLMNEGRVRSLATEVQNADETIYRQQLGLDWQPPPPVESPMVQVASRPEREVSQATLYASQVLSEAGSEAGSVAEESVVSVATVAAYPASFIKQVLELLCEESGFLIESKLTRLLAPLDGDEQVLMKLDSVFKALGIETEEDIHKLVRFFVRKDDEKRLDTQSTVSGGVSGVQVIHPNEVPQALRKFVERTHASGKLSKTLRSLQGMGSHDELLDGVFWTEMAKVLPENHERVWSALLEGLDRYHSALQARSKLIRETDGLRQQNMELRLLLQQYMHARINYELEIPPTLMLPVNTHPSPG